MSTLTDQIMGAWAREIFPLNGYHCPICDDVLHFHYMDGNNLICLKNHYVINFNAHTLNKEFYANINFDMIIGTRFTCVRGFSGTHIIDNEAKNNIKLEGTHLSLKDCLNESKIKTYVLFS